MRPPRPPGPQPRGTHTAMSVRSVLTATGAPPSVPRRTSPAEPLRDTIPRFVSWRAVCSSAARLAQVGLRGA